MGLTAVSWIQRPRTVSPINAPEEDLPILANIANGEMLWFSWGGRRIAGRLLGIRAFQRAPPKR